MPSYFITFVYKNHKIAANWPLRKTQTENTDLFSNRPDGTIRRQFSVWQNQAEYLHWVEYKYEPDIAE